MRINHWLLDEALLSEYKEVMELDRIAFPEDWETVRMMRR